MQPRKLRKDLKLDRVWEELVYTSTRLKKAKHADILASELDPLIDQTQSLMMRQWDLKRKNAEALAGVDSLNSELEDMIRDFARVLLQTENFNRRSLRFKRYFPKPPSVYNRLSLKGKMKHISLWPEVLEGETEEELREWGKMFKDILHRGQEALNFRSNIHVEQKNFKIREVTELVSILNAKRLSLYTSLLELVQVHKLPRNWAGRFFLRGRRKR